MIIMIIDNEKYKNVECKSIALKATDDCTHCIKDGIHTAFNECTKHNRRLSFKKRLKNKFIAFDENLLLLYQQIFVMRRFQS